jgi:hypothetical protein
VAAMLLQQQNIPAQETDNGLEGDSDPATEELQQSGNGLDESEVSNFKAVPAAVQITQKNVTETSTDNELKKTVGTLPTKKKAGTLRRSNHHQANKDEHTLEKTTRMAQICNLENPSNKSFISFSDSRISSNLDKVGISLGRDDNGIRCSTVAIKI